MARSWLQPVVMLVVMVSWGLPASAFESLVRWPPPAWECPASAQLRQSASDDLHTQSCVLVRDGSLHGQTGIWDSSRKIVRMLEYRNDVENGRVRQWYRSGRLALDGSFSDGEPAGLWTEWFPSGSIRSRVRFRNGEFDGASAWWHESGAMRVEGVHVNGRQEGLWISWWEDGSPRSECRWRGGRRLEPCQEWSPGEGR